MEATQKSNELGNLETPKKEDIKRRMERKDSHQLRVSGSRRTRSQAAPDWSVNDALILVNEISSVEGDCLKALSSYQKWQIIAENCSAFDVIRTSNQCRRKWDALLVEYNKIKQWERSGDSYWSLETERRKEFGLPDSFDNGLFDAIDNLVKAQEGRSDTEPESDPEAEGDVLDVTTESGSKKPRCQVIPQQIVTVQEKELMMAAKLHENAERIHAILEGKPTENHEAFHTDFIRCQGDKLIACLGDVVNNLHQLCDLVQESG